jgi:YggT family protein
VVEFLVFAISVYSFALVVRVVLSWFPVNWYAEPFRSLSNICDPYLLIWRRLIPPFGGIDFSPIVGLLVLEWVQAMLLLFLRGG